MKSSHICLLFDYNGGGGGAGLFLVLSFYAIFKKICYFMWIIFCFWESYSRELYAVVCWIMCCDITATICKMTEKWYFYTIYWNILKWNEEITEADWFLLNDNAKFSVSKLITAGCTLDSKLRVMLFFRLGFLEIQDFALYWNSILRLTIQALLRRRLFSFTLRNKTKF